MAADTTSFTKALADEYKNFLERLTGKPYPGPGKWIELTPTQEAENADWRRRRDEALAFVNEHHDDVLTEAETRFGVEVYEDIIEGGGFEVSGHEPHSRTFVPDDEAAYKQWRKDHPGDFERMLSFFDREPVDGSTFTIRTNKDPE